MPRHINTGVVNASGGYNSECNETKLELMDCDTCLSRRLHTNLKAHALRSNLFTERAMTYDKPPTIMLGPELAKPLTWKKKTWGQELKEQTCTCMLEHLSMPQHLSVNQTTRRGSRT